MARRKKTEDTTEEAKVEVAEKEATASSGPVYKYNDNPEVLKYQKSVWPFPTIKPRRAGQYNIKCPITGEDDMVEVKKLPEGLSLVHTHSVTGVLIKVVFN